MPTYSITAPDGREFEVTGPGTHEEALAHVQQNYKAEPQQAVRDLSAGLKGGMADPSNFDPTKQEAPRWLPRAEEIYGKMGPGGEYGRPLTWGEYGMDKADSIMSGLGQGVAALPGLPGTAQKGATAAADWIGRKVRGISRQDQLIEQARFNRKYGRPTENPYQLPDVMDTIGAATKGMQRLGTPVGQGLDYEPKDRLGRVLQTGASFVPGGGLAKEAALMGGTYQLASEAAPDSTIAPLAAAALAPFALKKVAARGVTPFAAGAEEREAAKVLKNAGVRISAGQKSGNAFLRFIEDNAGSAFNKKQIGDLTRYAASLTGTDARKLTPKVLEQIDQRFSREFGELGSKTTIDPSHDMLNGLTDVRDTYTSMTGAATRKDIVAKMIGDVVRQMKKGPASGAEYQNLRSKALKLARNAGADSDLRNAMNGIAHVIDDGMEASIAARNPELLGRYKTVRRQYKNLQPLEDALSRADPYAKMGLITPAAFEGAVKKGLGKKSWNRAHGDAAEVARAAGMLMKPLANSNTAARWAARLAIGGGAGTAYEGGDLFSPGTLVGAVAPTLIAKAILSKPGRAIFGNQLLANTIRSPTLIGSVASRMLGRRP